jgi:hypothetical protein
MMSRVVTPTSSTSQSTARWRTDPFGPTRAAIGSCEPNPEDTLPGFLPILGRSDSRVLSPAGPLPQNPHHRRKVRTSSPITALADCVSLWRTSPLAWQKSLSIEFTEERGTADESCCEHWKCWHASAKIASIPWTESSHGATRCDA